MKNLEKEINSVFKIAVIDISCQLLYTVVGLFCFYAIKYYTDEHIDNNTNSNNKVALSSTWFMCHDYKIFLYCYNKCIRMTYAKDRERFTAIFKVMQAKSRILLKLLLWIFFIKFYKCNSFIWYIIDIKYNI